VAVGGTGVVVGSTGVAVGGTGVAVGSTGVAVGSGTTVGVGETVFGGWVALDAGPVHARVTIAENIKTTRGAKRNFFIQVCLLVLWVRLYE
jgi:hypothetical protein